MTATIKIETLTGKGVDTAHNIIATMRKVGWKKLGSGVYGYVAQHPSNPNAVIKCGYGHNRVDNQPDGYSRYLCLVAEQQSNPHLPRVSSLECRVFEDVTIFVAVLEKLNDFRSMDKKAQTRLIRSLFPAKALELGRFESMPEQWKKAPTENARKALKLVHELSQEGYILDLHQGNIMVRGDHTLVITDPVN